ncbi:hypothetical protein [Streptomyces sp. NPDC054784]
MAVDRIRSAIRYALTRYATAAPKGYAQGGQIAVHVHAPADSDEHLNRLLNRAPAHKNWRQ